MEREHPERLAEMLERIAKRILGVSKISTRTTEDGRLLLCFYERGLEKPLYADQMSDGTLKLVAHMLLLNDPEPPPFVCFEEPENGLYHKLLAAFVDEIRSHCDSGAQFFITTHQPYLVDALNPSEVWILEKGPDGAASVRRASDDSIVRGMVEGGLPLGALWYSEYLEGE
jgi:predicted ATPase